MPNQESRRQFLIKMGLFTGVVGCGGITALIKLLGDAPQNSHIIVGNETLTLPSPEDLFTRLDTMKIIATFFQEKNTIDIGQIHERTEDMEPEVVVGKGLAYLEAVRKQIFASGEDPNVDDFMPNPTFPYSYSPGLSPAQGTELSTVMGTIIEDTLTDFHLFIAQLNPSENRSSAMSAYAYPLSTAEEPYSLPYILTATKVNLSSPSANPTINDLALNLLHESGHSALFRGVINLINTHNTQESSPNLKELVSARCEQVLNSERMFTCMPQIQEVLFQEGRANFHSLSQAAPYRTDWFSNIEYVSAIMTQIIDAIYRDLPDYETIEHPDIMTLPGSYPFIEVVANIPQAIMAGKLEDMTGLKVAARRNPFHKRFYDEVVKADRNFTPEEIFEHVQELRRQDIAGTI